MLLPCGRDGEFARDEFPELPSDTDWETHCSKSMGDSVAATSNVERCAAAAMASWVGLGVTVMEFGTAAGYTKGINGESVRLLEFDEDVPGAGFKCGAEL